MSANYTQNYELCQWEPSDKVLREDFNADNAKLDTALTNIAAKADAAKTQAQAVADSAYTKDGYSPVTAGFYNGNGASSREIVLGFKPKAVIVCMANGSIWNDGMYDAGSAICVYGGLATEHYSCGGGITVTEKGFRLYHDGYNRYTNVKGYVYSYVAFR